MVSSPCIKECWLHLNKCTGCGRTREEIMVWTKLEEAERKQIMERLKNDTNK